MHVQGTWRAAIIFSWQTWNPLMQVCEQHKRERNHGQFGNQILTVFTLLYRRNCARCQPQLPTLPRRQRGEGSLFDPSLTEPYTYNFCSLPKLRNEAAIEAWATGFQISAHKKQQLVREKKEESKKRNKTRKPAFKFRARPFAVSVPVHPQLRQVTVSSPQCMFHTRAGVSRFRPR